MGQFDDSKENMQWPEHIWMERRIWNKYSFLCAIALKVNSYLNKIIFESPVQQAVLTNYSVPYTPFYKHVHSLIRLLRQNVPLLTFATRSLGVRNVYCKKWVQTLNINNHLFSANSKYMQICIHNALPYIQHSSC